MPFHNLPKTVDEAVERLLDELSLKEKARIAKMDASDLKVLHITFGPHIRAIFGFWTVNEELLASCSAFGGEKSLDAAECSAMIIDVMWARLRRTHSLRAVK